MDIFRTKRLMRRVNSNLTHLTTQSDGTINSSNHLVTPTDFKSYITKDNKLLDPYSSKRKKIEIDNAMDIMSTRHTYYKNIESNEQFITAYKNEKTHNRLQEMFNHLLGNMLADLVMVLLKYNKRDNYILKFIKDTYNPKNKDWSENRHYKISRIADTIGNQLTNIKKPKILDVGVGNGKKIQFIKSQLHCDIYGADIEEWGTYSKSRSFDFPYKTIKLSPYSIPYDNKQFNCILLSLVLHHCDDILAVIQECKRLLDNNGIIVIIEHDVWTDFDQLIIDIQHRIYECINNEKEQPEGQYMNFFEWNIIFEKCNMKPVYMNRITESVSGDIRYDLQYIGIYKQNETT